nr:MAG TPA: hypothetical protein [Caudoviricetes sp.]
MKIISSIHYTTWMHGCLVFLYDIHASSVSP